MTSQEILQSYNRGVPAFFQCVIPLFTRFNMLLQRDDPLIFLLYAEMRAFLKNVLSRFIQVQSIADPGDDITKVKYKDPSPSCQMSDDKLYIGIVTRVKQRKLLDEGDIDSNASLTFFKGIQSFYHCATEYALSHLSFDDDVLLNAQFVNIQRRVTADFTQVAYFVEHFPIPLPFCDTKSQEQFF